MNTPALVRAFGAIGARVGFGPPSRRAPRALSIDILHDDVGEFYFVRSQPGIRLDAVDVRPRHRHLLLLSQLTRDAEKEKFLCGHDERHWFVAAVPPIGPVASVAQAFDALKPPLARSREQSLRLSNADRRRRRNPAFVRQGEWFFTPAPDFYPGRNLIFTNEPLRRGGGKAHIVERLVRTAGETVYVSHLAPNGLTQDQYRALITRDPSARRANWQVMRRNAAVFVEGRVRHSDHATITLRGWHRVEMNTENQAPSMRHVAFLD